MGRWLSRMSITDGESSLTYSIAALRKAIRVQDLPDGIAEEYGPDRYAITFADDLLFESSSDRISPRAFPVAPSAARTRP